MPRKRKVAEPQVTNDLPLMLQAPVRVSHPHEHRVNPYEVPPGGNPVHVQTIKTEPLERQLSGAEEIERARLREESKVLAARAHHYLDAMARFEGDQEQALADVFGVSVEEARLRRPELHAEVVRGLHNDLNEILQHNDLTLAARASVLKRWMYSDNPAASLKAADMIGELEGDRVDSGSFEYYVRVAKQQSA